jgi:hypothetical protein
MKPRTKSLFHFTKSLEKLCCILEEGFWPRYCHEYIGWIAYEPEFIAMPIVCFCDIPISRLTEHTDFYGKFGIGMTKEWGINKGLNPVIYVSNDSNLFTVLKGLFENPHPNIYDSKFFVMQTLSYTKPLMGKMKRGKDTIDKYFYEECEWRYVPVIYEDAKYAFLVGHSESNNPEIIEEANAERRKDGMLKFSLSDVRYLLVEKTSDIPILVDFIYTKLAHFSNDELKIFVTKIVSFDEIIKDI